jgi:hypothetical protein
MDGLVFKRREKSDIEADIGRVSIISNRALDTESIMHEGQSV